LENVLSGGRLVGRSMDKNAGKQENDKDYFRAREGSRRFIGECYV